MTKRKTPAPTPEPENTEETFIITATGERMPVSEYAAWESDNE